jgi:hypothetical protein
MYIYALLEPDTQEPRYVGKTNDLRKRYSQHICNKAASETSKAEWIQSLRSNGLLPLMCILEVVGNNWRERERFWIADLQARGAQLVNETKGGDGPDGHLCKPIPVQFFALV